MGNFLFIRKMCFLWLPLFAGFGFCLSVVLLNGRIRGGWRGFGCMAVYKQCPRVFAWLHVLRLGVIYFPAKSLLKNNVHF